MDLADRPMKRPRTAAATKPAVFSSHALEVDALALKGALEEYSFAVLALSLSERQALQGVMEAFANFFSASVEEKVCFAMREPAESGWVVGTTREQYHATVASLGHNTRDQGTSARLDHSVHVGLRVLHSISCIVLRSVAPDVWLLWAARVAAHLPDMSVFDAFFYPNRVYEEGLNLAAHTDPGLLTLGPCPSVPGLQLWVNERWLDAAELCDPTADHVIVFANAAMQKLTRGRIRALSHRVVAGCQPRLSLYVELRMHDDEEDPA